MGKFKRHIWKDLTSWKGTTTRKPLILIGARQVDKTTVARNFGATYTHFIELNLEKAEDFQVIERSNNAQELLSALALRNEISSSQFSKTLLFIDEIQESQKAFSFLRYCYERLQYITVVESCTDMSYNDN